MGLKFKSFGNHLRVLFDSIVIKLFDFIISQNNVFEEINNFFKWEIIGESGKLVK